MVYTTAFVTGNVPEYLAMARILLRSLLRVGETNVMLFHNLPEWPGRSEFPSVIDIRVEKDFSRDAAMCFKYEAEQFIDGVAFDRVTYIDSDCIILKSLAPFERSAATYYIQQSLISGLLVAITTRI